MHLPQLGMVLIREIQYGSDLVELGTLHCRTISKQILIN
jgi:hypothetical protein